MNQKYRYVDVDDVYRTSGLRKEGENREDIISRDDVEANVERAEAFVCRLTKNIYYKYNLKNQGVTSATSDTILSSGANWITNEWSGQFLFITSGTGSGQYRQITSNTNDTITVNKDFLVEPDATSAFHIFYVPSSFSPYEELVVNGNNRRDILLPKAPLNALEYVEIDNTVVDPDTVFVYEDEGKIELSPDSEMQVFLKTRPKLVKINYWYGVPDLSSDVKRLVELKAALGVLSSQMGGTFDVPSTFSLPDLSVSIGQAYINIKGTVDVLQKEYDELLTKVRVYAVFA